MAKVKFMVPRTMETAEGENTDDHNIERHSLHRLPKTNTGEVRPLCVGNESQKSYSSSLPCTPHEKRPEITEPVRHAYSLAFFSSVCVGERG